MIKYPITCVTNGSKNSWLMKAQELLRLEHNHMGAWHNTGITETRYQKLRAQVQIDFPYHAGKLSKVDWERYKSDRFDRKQKKINEAIGQMKQNMFNSTTYSPNLDDDITDAI
jgi:hypothetical protein